MHLNTSSHFPEEVCNAHQMNSLVERISEEAEQPEGQVPWHKPETPTHTHLAHSAVPGTRYLFVARSVMITDML